MDNHLPDPGFFYDDGWSGVTFARPAFTEIMELAEAGVVANLVVKDHSRLDRNRLVVGQLLEEGFVPLDVRYIAIMDNIDTAKNTSDKVRQVTRPTELTPEIVHEFIKKIVIHQPEKRDGSDIRMWISTITPSVCGAPLIRRRWRDYTRRIYRLCRTRSRKRRRSRTATPPLLDTICIEAARWVLLPYEVAPTGAALL